MTTSRNGVVGVDNGNQMKRYYERYAVREANKPLASISLKKNRLRIVKSVYAAI